MLIKKNKKYFFLLKSISILAAPNSNQTMKTKNNGLKRPYTISVYFVKKPFFLLAFLLLTAVSNINGQCLNTTAYATEHAPVTGSVTFSYCQYQDEYATLEGVIANTTYKCANDIDGYITVRAGSYDGPIIEHGPSPLQWSATSSETHYIHWNTDELCGQATNCGITTCDFVSNSGGTVFVPYSGNNTYTLNSGTITDHGLSADYDNYADGYTTIYPLSSGSMIQLNGTLDTESSYDYLYIYDGETTSGTLLYEGSGDQTLGPITSSDISGALTIKFTSDVSNVSSGFELFINAAMPCTGTPNAGILDFSSSIGCANESITITATGVSNDANISYLWMSSSSPSGPFFGILGQTNTSIIVSPSVKTYYKLKTTCENNALTNETPVGNRDIYSVSTTSGYTCGSGTVDLSASVSSGNVEWYSVASGGTSFLTGNNFTTSTLVQSTTYYVANSNCPSDREGIIASVKAVPTVDAGTNDSYCYGENTQLNGSITGSNDNGSIGNGTSGFYQSPLNRFYDYSCSEMIYLQTEIGKSGPINTLSFNKFSGDNSVVISDITVYMKHSTASSFVDGTTSTAGYTQVYSGSFPNNALGWNEITLTTPFNYDNINNLQILVVKGYEAYTFDRPYYKYTNSSPTNTIRMYYSDVDEWTSSQTLTADYWRPDIQFTIGNSVTQAWTPTTGLDDPNSLTPTTTSSATITYTLEATSSNGCVVTSPVTITVNALPTINTTPAASCGDASLNLSATSSSATSVEWFTVLSGGSAINSGNNYTTPFLNSTTTYYTSTTDANGCTTSPREPISATINSTPTADAGVDKNTSSMCGLYSVSMDALLDPGFTGEWSVLSGVNVLPNDPTDPVTTIYPASYGGTTILQWEITNSSTGCQDTENVEVSFLQPTTSNISNPQTGELLWGGMQNNDWGNSSNWYEYQSGSYWKTMASGEPSNSHKVYIISGNDGGICISDNNFATPANNETVGDLSVLGGSTFDLNNGSIYISGDINNEGNIIGSLGSVVFDGTTNQTINGNAITFYGFNVNKTNGDLYINTPISIINNFDMNQGLIRNTEVLTLGESSSKYGTLNYTNGFIHGAFKRYFPNNAVNDVLFPVGKAGFEREMTISFNSSPGNDQYITSEFITGVPGSGSGLYNGLPLTTNDGQLIQQYSSEGYWQIDPTNNDYTSEINLTPYSMKLHAKTMSGVNDRSTIRLIKSPGPSHDTWIECGNYSSTIGSTNDDFYVVSENATGFSFFGMGGDNNNSLPVELISFNGNCNQGNVDLSWSTASEYNSDYFIIEKSRDGEFWNTIHQEKAAGNSTLLINYHYTDYNALSSENYYRLTQFDIDGTENKQDAIYLNCQQSNSSIIKTYPNPSNNNFKLVINDKLLTGNVSIKLIDTRGNVLSNNEYIIQKGTNRINMNKINLSKGLYYIIIENENLTSKKIKHIIH